MITTDLTRAALLASIPAAWALGVLTLPLLLIVVTCYGAASLVNDAASQSFVPRLVPRADLQRAHALAPWVSTWDDHEVQNNYADAHSQYGISVSDFERQRAVAYRAYYEAHPPQAAR